MALLAEGRYVGAADVWRGLGPDLVAARGEQQPGMAELVAQAGVAVATFGR